MTLTRLVKDDKSLTLRKVGSIEVHFNDKGWWPFHGQIGPFPRLEVVRDDVGFIEDNVELQSDISNIVSALSNMREDEAAGFHGFWATD